MWSSVNHVTYWGKGSLSHNSALPDSRTPSPRCQLYGAYQTLEPCKVGYPNEIIWLALKWNLKVKTDFTGWQQRPYHRPWMELILKSSTAQVLASISMLALLSAWIPPDRVSFSGSLPIASSFIPSHIFLSPPSPGGTNILFWRLKHSGYPSFLFHIYFLWINPMCL